MQQKKSSEATTVRGADPLASTVLADMGVNANTRPPLAATLDDPGDGGVTEQFLSGTPNYGPGDDEQAAAQTQKPRKARKSRRWLAGVGIAGCAVMGMLLCAVVLQSCNKKAAPAPVLNAEDLTNCEITVTDMGEDVQLAYPKGCKRLYHKE